MEFTPEQRAEAKINFDLADLDKSGTIDREELRLVLQKTLRKKLSEQMFQRYISMHFSSMDRDESGTIDFEGPGSELLAGIRDITKASQLGNMAG